VPSRDVPLDYDREGVAHRYMEARRLPEEALALWLDAVAAHMPETGVDLILDLGCGTGRFTQALGDRFSARVVGIDASRAMLAQAKGAIRPGGTVLLQAKAERLPLGDGTVDLAFLSMVYHHLPDKARAARELRRVLRPAGVLAVRTATRETLGTYLWLRFFPQAEAIERARMSSRQALQRTLEEAGLALRSREIVRHPFAQNLADYAKKIGLRGLSALRAIPDESFEDGMAQLREHCRETDAGEPVLEDIDLFVFAPQ
jgi:ubiquinone/menaquinone biosynthesis C-methylase UbiE